MTPAAGKGLLPWVLALLFAALAAASVAACLWKLRAPADPVQRTMARLATVDPVRRHKICAHRCNDVPKYRAAIELFDCVELDVVLQPPAGGPPAVYHPPEDNHHGLHLDFLLANEAPPRGGLWLDVKDLSEDNWRALLDQLLRQIPEARRGETVIETSWAEPPVAGAAAAFRARGFLFSYYLPTEPAIECGVADSAGCRRLREAVLETLAAGFSHLSFDARAWPFVRALRNDLPPQLRLLTWHISPRWPDTALIDAVDLYIVRFPTPHL